MNHNNLDQWILEGRYWVRSSDGFCLPVIQGGGMAVTVQNDKFAFGDDDNTEALHTLDTENTNRASQSADVTFMFRVQVEETAGGTEVQAYAIFAEKNGDGTGTFTEVTTGSTDGLQIADDTQSRADDENTTERLSYGGASAFQAGKYDDGQVQQGTTSITLDQDGNGYTDLEFALRIDSGVAVDSDYWKFRVEFSDGTDLDGYPAAGNLPQVTASVAASLSINLNTLQLQSNTNDINIQAGAATIPTNTLELSALTQDLTIDSPQTVAVNTLSLVATVNDLEVTQPLIVAVNTLSFQAQTNDIVVSPGAVTTSLDTLNIDTSAQSLIVSPGAITISLDTLQLQITQGYKSWLGNLERNNMYAHWALDETAGSIAFDNSPEGNTGTYTATDLNNSTGPDGLPVPYFDGTGSYVDIYSTGLDADFDADEGTISCWVRVVDSGVWTDGTRRDIINIGDGSNNYYSIYKKVENNQLHFRAVRSSISEDTIKTGLSTTDWFHVAITWSTAGDAVKMYFDGVQEGATHTGIGAWGLANLIESVTNFGSYSEVPIRVWNGWGSHVVLWDKALTSNQIAEIASLPSGIPKIQIVAGEATISADTLLLESSVEDIVIASAAVSTTLDTLSLNALVNDISIALGASTVSLNTLLLSSSAPSIIVTPDTVSITLGSLELSVDTVNLDVVTVADLTVAIETLLLQSNPQAINISPSDVSFALDTLLLNASANNIDVLLGAVSVILNTLSANVNAININISPGAVSSQLDTLVLNVLANDLNVSPATVSQLLDTLLLQSAANELSIALGAATVSVDTLALLSNILNATALPGAVTTSLDTLLLQGTANNVTISTVFPAIALDTLVFEANAITTVIAPAAATLSLDTLLLDANILDIIAQILVQTVSGGVAISDSLISDILLSDELINDVLITDSDNA